MVILQAYLKYKDNIIACVPFRYNIDEDKVTEVREIVLPVSDETTYTEIKQELVNLLDKEKQDYGRINFGDSGDLPSIVTIE